MNLAHRILALVNETSGQFQPLREAPWVADVEEKFGLLLPASFRSLITGFGFAQFEIGGVELFSNLNDGSPGDITVAPFIDPFMSPWLISRGYVQIGRPDDANYDPVCFDFSAARTEPPVIRLDHEDILMERRKVRGKQLAASFLELVETGIHK